MLIAVMFTIYCSQKMMQTTRGDATHPSCSTRVLQSKGHHGAAVPYLGPLVLASDAIHVKEVGGSSLQEFRLQLVTGVVYNHDGAWTNKRW